MDLENAASPEEADQLEEMTANEMAVDGYYVVAGIARHEYKQGWKFLTLWDGYGLSEAAWEPMSAFIQPDGSINPIFRSYLVENNKRRGAALDGEGQCAGCDAFEGYVSDVEVRLQDMHMHDQVFITKNDEHVEEISLKQ